MRLFVVFLLLLSLPSVLTEDSEAVNQTTSSAKEQTQETQLQSDHTTLLPTPTESASTEEEKAPTTHKQLKDRTNYASVDCGAQIQSTNSETKSPGAILSEDKDKYMINQCSADKFVIVELCDIIRADTIDLANFEFFSSMFKAFDIFVIDKYPPKRDSDWTLVGSFVAANHRNIQRFTIENPKVWSKHIKIVFNSHYGNEYLCPLSLLRVFGATMMEDLHVEDTSEPKQEPISFKGLKDLQYQQSSGSFYQESSLLINLQTVIENSNEDQKQDDTLLGSQENLFKSILKRLKVLERNISVSMRLQREQTILLDSILKNFDKNLISQLYTLREAWNLTVVGFMSEINRLDNLINSVYMQSEQIAAVSQILNQHSAEIESIQSSHSRHVIIMYSMLIGFVILYFFSSKSPSGVEFFERKRPSNQFKKRKKFIRASSVDGD